jgi:hypothetical protein
MKSEAELLTINKRLLFASVLAGVFACATFSLQWLATISDNPAIGAVQKLLVVLLFPGMIGAMALSGNVHAWYLWAAAAINAMIYFSLAWLIYGLAARLRRRAKPATLNV